LSRSPHPASGIAMSISGQTVRTPPYQRWYVVPSKRTALVRHALVHSPGSPARAQGWPVLGPGRLARAPPAASRTARARPAATVMQSPASNVSWFPPFEPRDLFTRASRARRLGRPQHGSRRAGSREKTSRKDQAWLSDPPDTAALLDVLDLPSRRDALDARDDDLVAADPRRSAPRARNMARDVACSESVATARRRRPCGSRLGPAVPVARPPPSLEAATSASAASTASTWCGGRPAAARSSTTSS